MHVMLNGQPVSHWSVNCLEGPYFEASIADLDGDGDDELIVINLEHQSVGIGISTSTIDVLEDIAGSALPMRIVVEDVGIGTLFSVPDRDGCGVLQTAWLEVKDPERGTGLYLVAQPLRYKQGVFISDGPQLARRYLHSFEDERLETFDEHEPLDWIQDSRTVILESNHPEMPSPTQP